MTEEEALELLKDAALALARANEEVYSREHEYHVAQDRYNQIRIAKYPQPYSQPYSFKGETA
jgi:hypothetical protein